MSNLTDALIAAKLVGGSGGSGGGSGLPEITTETQTIVEEQTVTVSHGGASIAGDYAINVGNHLVVSWNGTDYPCVAGEYSDQPVWGNLSPMGGPDTGEPFLMGYLAGTGISIMADDGTYTISISGEVQTPSDGSVLTVIDGEWTPHKEAGPLSLVFTETGGSVQPTVPFSALATAFSEKQEIEALLTDGANVIPLTVSNYHQDANKRLTYIVFSAIVTNNNLNNMVMTLTYTINNDATIRKNILTTS